jgi:hypothetical protein
MCAVGSAPESPERAKGTDRRSSGTMKGKSRAKRKTTATRIATGRGREKRKRMKERVR